MAVGGGFFRLAGIVHTVGVKVGGPGEEFLPQPVRVQTGAAGFVEQGEKVRHAVKLSPQEQLVAALGFFTLKPPSSVLT